MIISFEKYQKARRDKEGHRRQLVEQIEKLMQKCGESTEGAYMEHIRVGFPLHILESILLRLREKQSEVV